MPKIKIVANHIRMSEAAWSQLRTRTQAILGEFRELGAKQLNLRLNESDTEEHRPVFLDWVAMPSVIAKVARRSPETDIGRYRLGEGTPSVVYEQGLTNAGKKIIERDWTCQQLLKEKRVESKLAVQKAGLMYQKFIGIIAGDSQSKRCVGLLTVSFEKKPRLTKREQVDKKMKQLACWPLQPRTDAKKSDLVRYLEQTFILGGPRVKAAVHEIRRSS